MPPFTVQYFCPRQSPFWQGKGSFGNLFGAIAWAEIVKPPTGHARVLDAYGNVVFSI